MAGFFKNLYNKVANRAEIEWDELEADLIAADLGVRVSLEIVEHLQGLGRKISADDVVTAAREHIAQVFPDDDHNLDLREDGKPLVILVVGVNGTGKTTSTAKPGLGLLYRSPEGHRRWIPDPHLRHGRPTAHPPQPHGGAGQDQKNDRQAG